MSGIHRHNEGAPWIAQPNPVPRAASRLCPGLGFKYLQEWRLHTAWVTCPTVYPHNINHLFCPQGISGVLFCVHWHLPCQRAPLRRVWFPLDSFRGIFAELPSSHPWSALMAGVVPPHGQDLALRVFFNIIPIFTKLWA